MTSTTDIEELEGPFEQIAGSPESNGSGSSDSVTITLTIDKPVVDYGKIKLAKITNQDVIKDILDQGKSLIDRLKNFDGSPITPSDGDQIVQIANQFQTLTSMVRTMKLERSKAKGQATPAPVELTIVANYGLYAFEVIAGTPTDVHRKPGNSTDSLGTLSATSGKTDKEGKATIIFTPNGNYGKMTFKVKHADGESNLVPFERTGQFKEDAQKELQDQLDSLDTELVLKAAFIPLIGGIIGLLVARAGVVIAAMAALLGILAGIYAWLVLFESIKKQQKKLKEKNQPKIDELPSKT